MLYDEKSALPHGATVVAHANDRAALWLLAFALLAPWWLAYLSLPLHEFYKEWIFAVALSLGTLALARKPLPASGSMLRHPLTLASLSVLAVLLLQSLWMPDAWRKAMLMAAYVGIFVFCLAAGHTLREVLGARSLPWVAGCVVAAALGSCLFGAFQLNWIDLPIPLIAGRAGGRISGNTAQANHFADLLWLGCVATVLLVAWRRLRLALGVAIGLVLLVFCVFSGSRMTWVYALASLLFGGVCWRWRAGVDVRRFAIGLVVIGLAYPVIDTAVSASGTLDVFGVTSGSERLSDEGGADSTRLRLWLWHAGIAAAESAPWLGVGVGRYVGFAQRLAMTVPDSPPAAADANAHNVVIHLAAELGIPLALFVAGCIVWWLWTTWRRSAAIGRLDELGVLALCGVVLIHANLEYPLWYLYFLGLIGLLAGLVWPAVPSRATVPSGSVWPLRVASIAVLGVAMVAYFQYRHLEAAMQSVVMQVSMGAAPQPDPEIDASLAALPAWSPYGDYAQAIRLISALPTKDNAATLARQCNDAVVLGPSPYLLARCATAFQVAGQPQRATYFANSFCKLYPRSVGVLIESMMYVERSSPEVENLQSACVERTNAPG